MMGLATNYSPKEHQIIGGDISEWVSRLVENDPTRKNRLFVVRYIRHGTFVIAEWLGRPRDLFVDVMNLGKSLANFDRTRAKELRKRLFAPLTASETADALKGKNSDYLHQMMDDDAEESERQERVARGE